MNASYQPPPVLTQAKRGVRCHRWLIGGVVLVGALLRVVALDTYPTPYHQDELTDIYDGVSIATTSADRTGARWPILTRAMGPGGYGPTLNVYLCALTSMLGGQSAWAWRMPAVLGGLLTMWLVFLVARRLLGERGGIIALLLVAFSPIHILYARQVNAGVYLPPLLVALFVYLFDEALVRAADRSRPRPPWCLIALAGWVIGFSPHAYNASRITAPLLAIMAFALLIVACRRGGRSWSATARGAGVLTLTVLAGASLTIYAALATPELFFSRSGHVMPSLAHGPRWWLETMVTNLGKNLDPSYLFLSFGEFRQLSVARLGIASLPFLYVGLAGIVITSVRRRDLRLGVIPSTILIGLIPGVITTGNPNPMRTSLVWSMYPIVASYGALCLGRLVWRWRQAAATPAQPVAAARWTRAGMVATSLLIAASGCAYVTAYLRRPDLHRRGAQTGYAEIGTWLRDHGRDYDRVYVDVDGLFGELYVAAFSGMAPSEYQRTPREGTVTPMGWDKIHRLGRYRFAPAEQAHREWRRSAQDERWLVIRSPSDRVEFRPGVRVTSSTPSGTAHRTDTSQ